MTAPSQGDGGMVAAIEVGRGSFMRWHDGSEFTEQRTSLLYFEVPRSPSGCGRGLRTNDGAGRPNRIRCTSIIGLARIANLTVTEILASDRKVHEDASDGRGVENARVQKGGKSHRRPSS